MASFIPPALALQHHVIAHPNVPFPQRCSAKPLSQQQQRHGLRKGEERPPLAAVKIVNTRKILIGRLGLIKFLYGLNQSSFRKNKYPKLEPGSEEGWLSTAVGLPPIIPDPILRKRNARSAHVCMIYHLFLCTRLSEVLVN